MNCLTLLQFIGLLNSVAIFPPERDIFFHEYNTSAAYSAATFTLATTLVEAPFTFVANLVRQPSHRNLHAKLTPPSAVRTVNEPTGRTHHLASHLLPICCFYICSSEYGRSEFQYLHTGARLRLLQSVGIIFAASTPSMGLSVS